MRDVLIGSIGTIVMAISIAIGYFIGKRREDNDTQSLENHNASPSPPPKPTSHKSVKELDQKTKEATAHGEHVDDASDTADWLNNWAE